MMSSIKTCGSLAMSLTAQQLVAQARAAITEIDAERLRTLQAAGVPVIDVREPGEYAAGHIVGAINRSEEHTSELQSIMRISSAVSCLKNKKKLYKTTHITKL